MNKNNVDPSGSTFESFLEELGIKDEVYSNAIKSLKKLKKKEKIKKINN